MSHVSDIRLRALDGLRENCSWPAEVVLGFNIYAYAGGDPLNGTDPSGLASPENDDKAGQGLGSGADGSTRDSGGLFGWLDRQLGGDQSRDGVRDFINENGDTAKRFFAGYSGIGYYKGTAFDQSDVPSLIASLKMNMTAMLFTDNTGAVVQNVFGDNVFRPISADPALIAAIGSVDSGFAASVALRLAEFAQGGPLDFQRANGVNYRQFRDYSTIAIGIYGASAGVDMTNINVIQNAYAGIKSTFSSQEVRDPVYSNLPQRNTFNLRTGYGLFNRGLVGN